MHYWLDDGDRVAGAGVEPSVVGNGQCDCVVSGAVVYVGWKFSEAYESISEAPIVACDVPVRVDAGACVEEDWLPRRRRLRCRVEVGSRGLVNRNGGDYCHVVEF